MPVTSNIISILDTAFSAATASTMPANCLHHRVCPRTCSTRRQAVPGRSGAGGKGLAAARSARHPSRRSTAKDVESGSSTSRWPTPEHLPNCSSGPIQDRPSPIPLIAFSLLATHRRRLPDAGELVVKLRSMAAGEEPRVSHWRKPEHQELLLSGLRLAMGVSIGCSTTRPWPASRARVIGSRTSAAQGC